MEIHLRQKVLAVLIQRGEAIAYRDLIDSLWTIYPLLKEHFLTLHGSDEKKARNDLRIRLGMIVKRYPTVYTATKNEGVVLIGLAATPADELEEEEVEDEDDPIDAIPGVEAITAVYWYTFAAYRKDDGAYPIKVGRGANPLTRIAQQVTAMPEPPLILGTHLHADATSLERAVHAVLALRGKRKLDAPGAEWFVTTPKEVEEIIRVVLGN